MCESGDSLSTIQPVAGFKQARNSGGALFVACVPEEACAWDPAAELSVDSFAGCATEGYSGAICGTCSEGFGRSLMTGKCDICPSFEYTVVTTSLLLVLGVVALAALVAMTIKAAYMRAKDYSIVFKIFLNGLQFNAIVRGKQHEPQGKIVHTWAVSLD